METAKKGYPFGFYVCAFGFTLERLAFYTMKYILAIWIATNVSAGGLGLSDVSGANVSAWFVAATYITPLFGGYIADHWISPRVCVAAGMIMMGIGYTIAWKATSLGLVWVMVILVALGTGLFKGNMSGINGLLFNDRDRLDSAFSIQYSFVNIGSFLGTTFLAALPTIGLFGLKVSFNTVFLISAMFMFADALWFIIGGRASFGDAGKTPFKKDQREFVSAEKKEKELTEPLTKDDWKKIWAIILVTLLSGVFWLVWYMAYMPAYYYFGWGDGDDFLNKADWHIGGHLIPTSWFDSVNALVCIVLGFAFASLWAKFAKSERKQLSMFRKTALGTILVGVAYLVMVLANMQATAHGQCSVWWLALVCLLMSVGEMLFSPLGNSFISKLAPAKVLGLLLGFWPIAVFLAQRLYPALYAYLKTLEFNKGYGGVGVIVVVFGLILFFASSKLEKLER